MSEEEILKSKLKVSAILFRYNVPVEEAKIIGTFIEKLQQKNAQLKINCNIGNENLKFYRQENSQLKERIAYLERSNNRREDTILELRKELYGDGSYKERIEKAIEYANQSIKYPVDLNSYKLLEILKGDKG